MRRRRGHAKLPTRRIDTDHVGALARGGATLTSVSQSPCTSLTIAGAQRVYPGLVAKNAQKADQDLIDDVLDRLREQGGRATTARRLLLNALVASRGHRTVEELAADVRVRAPDINLSTVYRNLDELERLKVVDRTHLGHGPATYHLASAAHGHLVCEHCGKITEVPETMFDDLAARARQRYGFTVDPHRFAVIGLCADCR